jgi:hypothetical protein
MIKFVSYVLQVSGFLGVLWFPPPIKLIIVPLGPTVFYTLVGLEVNLFREPSINEF